MFIYNELGILNLRSLLKTFFKILKYKINQMFHKKIFPTLVCHNGGGNKERKCSLRFKLFKTGRETTTYLQRTYYLDVYSFEVACKIVITH